MDINPQILEKNGRKEFVVFPYEDFRSLREAKETERDSPTISLKEAKKQLDIK